MIRQYRGRRLIQDVIHDILTNQKQVHQAETFADQFGQPIITIVCPVFPAYLHIYDQYDLLIVAITWTINTSKYWYILKYFYIKVIWTLTYFFNTKFIISFDKDWTFELFIWLLVESILKHEISVGENCVEILLPHVNSVIEELSAKMKCLHSHHFMKKSRIIII